MLRSRTNNKTAHKANGSTTQEPSFGSSFSKYGLCVCIFFVVIIVYVAFTSDTNPLSQSDASKAAPLLNPMAAKITPNIGLLNPKVLTDLKPADNANLQRLRDRQDRKVPRNKLNMLHHPLSPLNALSSPHSRHSDNVGIDTMDSDAKEIHLTLDALSLPRTPGKAPIVFVRQSYPAQGEYNHDFVLLFLHGAAYSSATWSELGILSALAKQGYVSYAVDVPGYGQSTPVQAINNKWLYEIIGQLIGNDQRVSNKIVAMGGVNTLGKKLIVVTASMSGQFAVPLLFNLPHNMVGLITIAPVGTEKYTKAQYEAVSVPVCIIYGEEDKNLGARSKDNLIQIPNHKLVKVPGGQHAAYKTDPKFFHNQVVSWLTEFFD